MRDFIITTDSNSDLPAEYINKNQIIVIPHYYDMDGITYGDEVVLSPKEFYDRMRTGSMPTTMASNPAVIDTTFRKIISDGYDILHISFSSVLSGGYNNVSVGAQMILEELPNAKIHVIDSLNASLGQGLLIMKAVSMRNAGNSLGEIVAWLEENKLHYCAQVTVDDLHHLSRGGRLSKTSAILGSMMNVKPILYVDDNGALQALQTVRGRKKSLSTLALNMEERVGSYKDRQDVIGIIHGDAPEDATYLEHIVREKYPNAEIVINAISPSIGAHSGPGTVGLCFVAERR